MATLSMCRVCLVADGAMHSLVNTKLQELYENMTAKPFQRGDGRPLQVCYVCYARLQNCYRLQTSCLRSEELFTRILAGDQVNLIIPRRANEFKIVHPIIHLSCVPVTLMLPEKKETTTKENVEGANKPQHPSPGWGPGEGAAFPQAAREDLRAGRSSADSVKSEKPDEEEEDPGLQRAELSAPGVLTTAQHFMNAEALIQHDLEAGPGALARQYDDMFMNTVSVVLHRADLSRLRRRRRTVAPAIKKQKPAVKNGNRRSTRVGRPKTKATERGKLTSEVQTASQHAAENGKVNQGVRDSRRPYKCDMCEKRYKKKGYLTAHMRAHIDKKPYKCNMCDEVFRFKSHLNKHVYLHTIETLYKCDICDKRFSYKNNLIQHVRLHTNGKLYKCDVCDKSFNQKVYLSKHVRLHSSEKPYKCGTCEKRFNLKQSLTHHLLIHTGEKPFKCNTCSKSFNQKQNLLTHSRIHAVEKPFQCDTCKRGFNQKQHLIEHIPTHTDSKPYKCDKCDKCFNHQGNLLLHSRIHTGEKPFKCDTCDKRFTQKGNLQQHLRLHTGEKPYKCDKCGRRFKQMAHLVQHSSFHGKL